MANPDPVAARQARRKKRRGRPGNIEDTRRLLWAALERAEELLEVESEDPDTGELRPDNALALKAIHAISQGAAAYAKILEVGELEARIAALEGTGLPDGGGPGPRLGRGAA